MSLEASNIEKLHFIIPVAGVRRFHVRSKVITSSLLGNKHKNMDGGDIFCESVQVNNRHHTTNGRHIINNGHHTLPGVCMVFLWLGTLTLPEPSPTTLAKV